MAKTERTHGRDLTAEEMAQTLDEFANKADKADVVKFAEQVCFRTHRTLQQKIMGMFIACIEVWAKDEFGHDARNQDTVDLSKKFVAATGDKYDRGLRHI